jgi:hypothetical protein
LAANQHSLKVQCLDDRGWLPVLLNVLKRIAVGALEMVRYILVRLQFE